MAESLQNRNLEEELIKARKALDDIPDLGVDLVINMGSEHFERYCIAKALERAFLLGRVEALEAAITGRELNQSPSYSKDFIGKSDEAEEYEAGIEDSLERTAPGGSMPRPSEHLFGEQTF